MADFFAYQGPPGPSAATTTSERYALWGGATWYLLKSIHISSAARDSNNSTTTELRHGLLMGQITSSKKYKEYNVSGTDGSEKVEGFLWEARRVTDTDGTATDRTGQLCVCGPVKNGQLILLDQLARAQMHGRFIFDDDLVGNTSGWQRVIVKTANYTVVAADNNTIFTTRGASGAVTFTLPTIAKGLRYRFVAEADQNLIVASAAADTLVATGDLAASDVRFSTPGQKIGGVFEVYANDNASKWLVMSLSPNTVTVTA